MTMDFLNILQTILPPQMMQLTVILMLILSLALIFAGKNIVKALIFLVAGFATAALAATLASLYVKGISVAIIGLLGFFVGGLGGVLLLPLGIGLVVGYFGYAAVITTTGNLMVAVVVGVVLFILGVVLANKILVAMTVVAGGMLFFSIAIGLGLTPLLAALAAILLSAAGLYIQSR